MKNLLKKRIILSFVLFLSMPFIGNSKLAHAAEETPIQETQDDTVIIPDKYNTGCTGTLFDFRSASEEERIEALGGFTRLRTGDATAYKINFSDKELLHDAVYVFENIDFSDRNFQFLGPATNDITVVFKNCKFKHLICGANVKATLENCSLEQITARDVVCNSCQFGHSYNDAIRAFNNSYFNNCYICDLQYIFLSNDPKASQHIDGVQIFGNLDHTETSNIHFYNTRFEIPTYYIGENNKAGMNNCIYVQIEYSDASNITFEHIITNGAGYQFSAHQCKCPDPAGWKLEGVSLNECRFGEGSIYGALTAVEPQVELNNISLYDSLYIGSCWKSDDQLTHFSVTNDTNRAKKLVIITDKETKLFEIPAYPLASTTNQTSNILTYANYPIDIDIAVDADNYAVCYDVTGDEPKQIRFVNYTEDSISIDTSVLSNYITPSEVVKSGTCGKQLTYTLTNDGILTISGEGAMTNYHSALLPPWYDDYVRKIILEDGVTTVGTQAFRKKATVCEVVFPSTLERIENNAFGGCSSLLYTTLPASLKQIHPDAFLNCFGLKINYLGKNWDDIIGGEGTAIHIIGYDVKNGWLKASDGTWKYYVYNVPKTGWLNYMNEWYYFDTNGRMLTGWIKDNNTWYYLASSGKMLTGWLLYKNDWYYLASSGKMLTGWVLYKNDWYYLASSGKMLTGWILYKNDWYYLDTNGKMQTGWIQYKNNWYYLYSNGKMATNTYIGNYYVNENGVWIK